MTGKTAESILQAIGNTPLVRLNKVVPANCAEVLVKLEFYNPTGSYKDRMALAMIEAAEQRGELRAGMTIVEYTGGSTGSSLAMVCAVKGYRFRVVSSDAFAREKLQMMRVFGAELTIVPSANGQITPELVPQMMERAAAIAREAPSYFTDQLNNADSVRGYEQIGRELVEQAGGTIHGFCASVGTAAMLMGVAHILRASQPATRIIALEPAASPMLSQGSGGNHHVEGIGIGLIPPLLDKTFFNEARGVDEAEAREMAWRLAREEGIFAGTSSGMNVVGAIALAKELGAGHRVVTVAVDSGLKYLEGDLYGKQ